MTEVTGGISISLRCVACCPLQREYLEWRARASRLDLVRSPQYVVAATVAIFVALGHPERRTCSGTRTAGHIPQPPGRSRPLNLSRPTLIPSPQGSEYLKTAIHITPSRASRSAIRAVEKAGGSVFCQYYNDLALKDCVKGRTDRTDAAPTRKTDIRAFPSAICSSCTGDAEYSQCGTRRGRIGATCHPRHCRRCLWGRTGGASFRSNFLPSRPRSTRRPSRVPHTTSMPVVNLNTFALESRIRASRC